MVGLIASQYSRSGPLSPSLNSADASLGIEMVTGCSSSAALLGTAAIFAMDIVTNWPLDEIDGVACRAIATFSPAARS